MARRITTQPTPPLKAGSVGRKPAARRRPSTPAGYLIAGCVLILTALLLGHRMLPNGNGFGSLLESFLPWIAVPGAALGLIALVLRSRPALIATGVAVLAWVAMFGPTLMPRGVGGTADLRVVSHNVYAANEDLTGTAGALRATGADVIAVQELDGAAVDVLHAELDPSYRYQHSGGTLAVWSHHQITDVSPVDVGMGWVRALRMTLDTPHGEAALYVVHLASIRLGADGLASQRRDSTLRALAAAIAADPAKRLILAGDLNTASTDRSLEGLTRQLTEAQDTAGGGFGFTWPAGFPMVRLDHILSRGLTVTESEVLAGTGSDHRPISASFRF